MKTMKYFFGAVLLVSFILTTPFSDGKLNSQEPPDDWGDAIYLGEAEITCSDNGYGRCHIPFCDWEREYGEVPEFSLNMGCEATGNPNDLCTKLYWIVAKGVIFWLPYN